MDRFTISLPEELAAEFDDLIAGRGYDNRSEAVRDILRSHLDRMREARELDGHCVANLSYVYNHHERELAERLLELSHAHHDLAVSTLHAHLDHEHCIESVILKGPVQSVRKFANSVVAERGVRHGQLNLVMVDLAQEHTHGDGTRHTHLKPQR